MEEMTLIEAYSFFEKEVDNFRWFVYNIYCSDWNARIAHG